MSATKKEIMTELEYCRESLERIIRYADKNYGDNYFNHHTVIQADIIKLRRELNEINKKLEWRYSRN